MEDEDALLQAALALSMQDNQEGVGGGEGASDREHVDEVRWRAALLGVCTV